MVTFGSPFSFLDRALWIRDNVIMKRDYLKELREGRELSLKDSVFLTCQLALPAIMAYMAAVVMQYIDASMVGRLGANDSASIGLVSSTTWLFGGLLNAAAVGYTVPLAQNIGAGKTKDARNLVKIGLIVTLLWSVLLGTVGVLIAPFLPGWLGGAGAIRKGATAYFLIYALSSPFMQMNYTCGGMLQGTGNMKTVGALDMSMCVLDVIYNAFLIFPTGSLRLGAFRLPGAGLGIAGASLGTALSQVSVSVICLWYLVVKSEELHFRKDEPLHFDLTQVMASAKLSLPVAFEQIVTCLAYIGMTVIVSPLGTISIATHSFAITAESLCYMPGYGIASASQTMVGQSTGAGQETLTRRLGFLGTILAMILMSVSGMIMYALAPVMIGVLSPDAAIRALGTKVLRIEAFAEPFYAASIVAAGVLRGAGDTRGPSILNFVSMWCVRLPAAWFLSHRMGLVGVWIAMCTELIVRGCLFLIKLKVSPWHKPL